MAQNVILQGLDLERSRSSTKIKKLSVVHIAIYPQVNMCSFLEILLSVFPLHEATFSEKWPGERIWRKHFDSC